jgi:hypothetical protein
MRHESCTNRSSRKRWIAADERASLVSVVFEAPAKDDGPGQRRANVKSAMTRAATTPCAGTRFRRSGARECSANDARCPTSTTTFRTVRPTTRSADSLIPQERTRLRRRRSSHPESPRLIRQYQLRVSSDGFFADHTSLRGPMSTTKGRVGRGRFGTGKPAGGNHLTVRLASTRTRRAPRWRGWPRVGGHRLGDGRF